MEKGCKGIAPQRNTECAGLCAGEQGLWEDAGAAECAASGPEPVRALDAEARSSMSMLGSLTGHRNLRREAALSHSTGPREGSGPQPTKGEAGWGARVPLHSPGLPPHLQGYLGCRAPQAHCMPRGSCPTAAAGLPHGEGLKG